MTPKKQKKKLTRAKAIRRKQNMLQNNSNVSGSSRDVKDTLKKAAK